MEGDGRNFGNKKWTGKTGLVFKSQNLGTDPCGEPNLSINSSF